MRVQAFFSILYSEFTCYSDKRFIGDWMRANRKEESPKVIRYVFNHPKLPHRSKSSL